MKKLIIISQFFLHFIAYSQSRYPITVALQVNSPYSNKFSDYSSKTKITLRNTNNFTHSVILRLKFTNNKGVFILTNSNSKPNQAIEIPANGSYNLKSSDLQNLYASNSLTFRGTSSDAILPEGNYSLCVTALDYLRPTEIRSDESCANISVPASQNPIKVETTTVGKPAENIQAPNLIRPTNNDEIKARERQNIAFAWSNTNSRNYYFKLIELSNNQRVTENDFWSKSSLFDKTTSANLLILGKSDAELQEGKNYAWAVQALGENSEFNRRNTNGRSNINIFSFVKDEEAEREKREATEKEERRKREKDEKEAKEKREKEEKELREKKEKDEKIAKKEKEKDDKKTPPTLPKTPISLKKPLSEYKIELGNLISLNTNIKGKLLYAYPEDYSMEVVNNPNQPHSRLSKSNFTSKKADGKGFFDTDKAWFTSSFLNASKNAKPMPKTKVSLVMVYATQDKNYTATPYYELGNGWKIITTLPNTDLLNYTVNGQKLTETSTVLATTYTKENGEFNFSYIQKDTCKLVGFEMREIQNGSYNDETGSGGSKIGSTVLMAKTCILVVESPYYCSPVIFINPKPGENISLPEQTSLVKSFELVLRPQSSEKIESMAKTAKNVEEIKKGAALENINIELFRTKPIDPSLPAEEGQNLPNSSIKSLNMGNYANYIKLENVERVVALGKSNAEGKFRIPKTIKQGWGDKFIAHSFTSATTGVYNMYDGLTPISSLGTNELGYASFSGDFDEFLQFNTNYKYEKVDYDLIMKSKKPTILGKTVENAVALPNVNVFLLAKKSGNSGWYSDITKGFQEQLQAFQDALKGYPQINGYEIISQMPTDNDGYFEFKDLQAGDYKLVFQKDGFKTKSMKSSEKSYEPDAVLSLQVGMLMQLNEVTMIPSGRIQVCVYDEDKNRVVSDLRVDDSPLYVSEKAGFFKGCVFAMPAPAGKNRTLKVYPRSEEYFAEEYKIDIEEDGITNIKTAIIVFRHKHRMKITVNGVQGNNSMPLDGAKVEIESKGIQAITNGKGEALLTFESPGNSFLVKVTPPEGSNWTYFTDKLTNIPSKIPLNYEVKLTPAREIQAFVGDKEGKALKNAQVYVKNIKNYWNDQTTNYVECTTDDNGNCKLKGLPNDENNIEVFATKNNTDGITYIGDKKEAFWFSGIVQSKVDFKLQTQEGFVLKDIWGFPVQIEQINPLGNDAFEITGSLVNLPETGDFGLLSKETKLDFKKVKFIKSQIGENTHQPEADFIKTQAVSIPIRICTKLQGKANGNVQNGGLLNDKLTLKKGADGKGEISSPVVLELSSFEGAYQLKGKIEVSESISNPKVVIFKASTKSLTQIEFGGKKMNVNTDFLTKKKYLLGRNDGGTMQNLTYKVHNFQAEAVASKSYLYSDSVRLYSILHTNIQNMQPSDIALEAGYITILPDKIQKFEGGNNISFSLEKWKVTGQKINNIAWTYDQNNGGIIIPKAIVNTGLISVGLTNMVIKPDKLIADKLELDTKDASSLTLGGIVPLEVTKGSAFKFTFDPNCYHDYKPHWKLSLLAGNNQEFAARISNLDGLEDNQKIEFGSMNLFSDNQQQLNGADQKPLVFRKILNFSLNSIDVQADNFTMLGQASMNIPNMSNSGGGIVGQIMYSKDAKGKAVFNFKPLNYNIEGKGQVAFKPYQSISNQQLTSGKYVSTGKITVYDAPSGKSFVLEGRLVHEKTGNTFNTYIETLDKQQFPLGSKFLTVKSGIANSGMKVVSNQWDNLRLKAIMPNGTGGFEMLNDDESKRFMTLVVKGAIETDPDNGMVGLKGMDTGVGSISLFYDFKREEMRGNFFFKPVVPINFGLVNLTSSNVSMAVGSNGFFIMTNGTGEIALPGGLPLPVDAGMNFITGYYTTQLPQEDINTLISLSVKKSLPSFMKNGIKGMYSSVNLNAVPFDEGFSYGIEDVATVACWAKAGAAYEYRNYLNFNSLTTFEIGVGNFAYAGFDVGGKAEILSIGVSGSAHLDFQASLEDHNILNVTAFSLAGIKENLNNLSLMGCASVTASFAIEACAFGECIGGSVSKSISAKFGIEKLSPVFEFQFNDCGNGLPAMIMNDSGY
jgi:hypothetical protein